MPWALSRGCSALAGHRAVSRSRAQSSASAGVHGPALLVLPSCVPVACAPQHSSKSISFA